MAAAVAGAAVLAFGAPASAAPAAGGPPPYAFAEDALAVRGASTTSDAPRLTAGAVHRDTLPRDGRLIYRVDLEATAHAYVSAVAVPPPGARTSFQDGLEISLQNRDGSDCGSGTARFGAAEFPRPIAAYADRTPVPDRSLCREAGSYYVVVEREGGESSSGEPWGLELRHVLEPGLKKAGPTAPPGNWPSASPEPPAGGPRERAGGAGFSDAPGLAEGEWTDRIRPGESRFYRVPVDWGQQLFVSADLGSSTGGGFVGGALPVSLYNPALGLVAGEDSLSYDGRQKSVAFDPLPPVAYENRFGSDGETGALRFAGWYYLRVSLNPKVGGGVRGQAVRADPARQRRGEGRDAAAVRRSGRDLLGHRGRPASGGRRGGRRAGGGRRRDGTRRGGRHRHRDGAAARPRPVDRAGPAPPGRGGFGSGPGGRPRPPAGRAAGVRAAAGRGPVAQARVSAQMPTA
ncbi:hypothetical protein LUX01_12240 [Streptomyces sudanensis]|nr:hypothetical protein [Streptomyces sudanensis]MCP9987351.1 hypothetical protein [Streptomyces sudanensis]